MAFYRPLIVPCCSYYQILSYLKWSYFICQVPLWISLSKWIQSSWKYSNHISTSYGIFPSHNILKPIVVFVLNKHILNEQINEHNYQPGYSRTLILKSWSLTLHRCSSQKQDLEILPSVTNTPLRFQGMSNARRCLRIGEVLTAFFTSNGHSFACQTLDFVTCSKNLSKTLKHTLEKHRYLAI